MTASESSRDDRATVSTDAGERRVPDRLKLQVITGDGVYATAGRTVYRETRAFSFEQVGAIPVPEDGAGALARRLQTARPWKAALESLVGSFQTANLWHLSGSTLLATVGPDVFRSTDGGRSWTWTLQLPPSSPRMGVLPCGVCTRNGTTYLAEYPLSESASPRVMRSPDGGRTWEPFLTADVRHFHSIAVDPHDGALWLTTGDRDPDCGILRIDAETLDAVEGDGPGTLDAVEEHDRETLDPADVQTVGGGSQRWRAVELAFTDEAVVWGMDCAYAEENVLFALPRSELGAADPTPERVGAAEASVYYAETVTVDGDEWVVLSTAAEAGGDRTAPSGAGSTADSYATVIAAPAADLTDWTRLLTYTRRRAVTERFGASLGPPSANAYLLLASDPDRGLFVNPVNTVTDDGRIRRIPDSLLRR